MIIGPGKLLTYFWTGANQEGTGRNYREITAKNFIIIIAW